MTKETRVSRAGVLAIDPSQFINWRSSGSDLALDLTSTESIGPVEALSLVSGVAIKEILMF